MYTGKWRERDTYPGWRRDNPAGGLGRQGTHVSQGTKRGRSTLLGATAPLKRGTKLTLVSGPGEAPEKVTAEDVGLAEETPKPAGILYNAHDVKRLEDECTAIKVRLIEMGALPDRLEALITGRRNAAMQFALGRLLVLKGIVTEDELQGEELAQLRELLRSDLQQAENQGLGQNRGPQVQPVRRPGLIVARH